VQRGDGAAQSAGQVGVLSQGGEGIGAGQAPGSSHQEKKKDGERSMHPGASRPAQMGSGVCLRRGAGKSPPLLVRQFALVRLTMQGGTMPIQDSLSRAATVARWKAEQQMRLLQCQNRIRELEAQIRGHKARLAETALTLYTQQRLSDDELREICATIAQLHEQIREQQRLYAAIRNEQPPDQTYSATFPPLGQQAAPVQGGSLVWPDMWQGDTCPLLSGTRCGGYPG